jgi:hypothetical protein
VIALPELLAGENAAVGCDKVERTLGTDSVVGGAPAGGVASSSALLLELELELELELLTSTVRCRGDTMCRLRLTGKSS